MFTNEDLHDLIIKLSAELGVTGYDIGKNTTVSDQAAYKILNRETKSPRRKNLLEILDYLENKQLGRGLDKNGNKIVAEPEAEYKAKEESREDVYRQLVEAQKREMQYHVEIMKLYRILDKNKIPYKNIFEAE